MSNPTSPCNSRAGARPAGGWRIAAVLAAVLAVAAPLGTLQATDLSSVPLPTYTIGSTVDIKPNIMMVLDDSGSMAWDYLPDWANDTPPNYTSLPPYLTRNSAFNGVAYNPAVTYLPPVGFQSSGAKDTTTYPSLNGQTTATGAGSAAKPNWASVKNDGFGVQSTTSVDLAASNRTLFYTTVAGEYCNSPALTNCVTATAPTATHQYPAPLRWCDSAALTSCRGLQDSTFVYPRMAAPQMLTLTFTGAGSGGNSPVVSSITIAGKQIMATSTASSSNVNTVAERVAASINACTNTLTGNCTVTGYEATRVDNVLTIYASDAPSSAPTLVRSGTLTATWSATNFANAQIPLPNYSNGTRSTSAPPGRSLRTIITSTVNSYPYPGSAAKAPSRTDCAGSTCTYAEEMTNYANWWSYYRTRMQMMKTATSRAFASLDSDENIAAGETRYRVGYLTLNNNTSGDFVNIDNFLPAQKLTWFSKLFAARPNDGTPLRQALARAGQIYGGTLTGQSLYGTTVTDPLQYSCQKNYTILSSDGFWNGSAGTKLDRSSAIGNIDGTMPRPYNDGGTSQLQSRTSRLQQRTEQLQTRTGTVGFFGTISWSGWSNTASCTEVTSGSPRRQCRTNNGSWANVDACTVRTTPDATGKTISCQYASWSSWGNVASCTDAAQDAGPNYTTGTARECRGTAVGGTSNTLADVAAYYYNTDLRDGSVTGSDATGSCSGPVIPPSSTPSNLCENNVPPYGRDVNPKQHMTTHTLGLGAQGRMVFSPYQNDTGGQRAFQPDYWAQSSGDFFSVANGSIANPSSGVCPWLASGTVCTWPVPAADSPANIDDLWHAAVNGRGTYFSAADPIGLGDALTGVFQRINNPPRPGTAAAAASSNPNITSSDNFVFSSSYRSVDWFGELIMQEFNEEGELSPQKWSAMQLLDCATTPWQSARTYEAGQTFSRGGSCYVVESGYTSKATFNDTSIDSDNTKLLESGPVTRRILTANATGTLVPFTWAQLDATQKTYFSTPYIERVSDTQGLTQFCTVGPSCLTATAQTAAKGEALVNFLRGDRTFEGTYFRARTHVLGDIVSAEARYVKQPLQNYADPGYTAFRTLRASRAPTVYVGSNDGMLHAFNATTGQERWGFIPASVLPNLYKLADTDYANKHQYYVDGTPEVGDICPTAPATPCTAAQWRTIIVGGLAQGGKSFYALDITDPENPSLMWEFNNAGLGFTYSNPRITKLSNGTWVAIVASGYNNADGIGRLFVLNAATGALITTISTNVGTAAEPSGLTKLAARAPTASTDNTTLQVYGGDLLGNVWRFDVNGDIGAAGFDAHRLITLRNPAGVVQPITAKPTVAEVANKPLVIVGTGRYLGLSDLPDTTTYTMYAIKDKLDTVTLDTPRNSGSEFVRQTMIDGTCPSGTSVNICNPGQQVRTVTSNPVDWSVKNGWYIDFMLGGERSVSDATLALGTLVFTTVKPQPATAAVVVGCTGGTGGVNATSYLYYLDYLTGGAIDGTKNVVGELLCDCIATRPSVVKNMKGDVQGIIRMSGGGQSQGTDMGVTDRQDLPYSGAGGPSRRISWRELNGM